MMVLASLFTALMVVGAYLKIPIGPVPIVLSNLFVLLAGLLLGVRWGLASVGLYLFLGFVGLPVFSSGGGPAYFAGPGGGFLLGFLAAVVVSGGIPRVGRPHSMKDVAGLIGGVAAMYACGVPWMKHQLQWTWPAVLSGAVVLYLPGDALKVAGAFGILSALRRLAPEAIPTIPRLQPKPDDAAPTIDGT